MNATVARIGTRVRHRDTLAMGDSSGTAERLNPYDTEGPWEYVEFDNGLQCWVPTRSLEFLSVLGWIYF